jgi:hypothetical protein
MEYVDLELEFLTPAFVSGGDQNACELRAASIKGVLRWWWRATLQDPPDSPKTLLRREQALFGGTDPGFRSRVLLAIRDARLQYLERGSRLPKTRHSFTTKGPKGMVSQEVLPYLAYGPVGPVPKEQRIGDRAKDDVYNDPSGRMKRGPLLLRSAIAPGSRFVLRLGWRGTVESRQIAEVLVAACAWVTLGGLGSRSRKGFGALAGSVVGASSPELLGTAQRLWQETEPSLLRDGVPWARERIPAFPRIEYRRIRTTGDAETWTEALGRVGMAYRELRKGTQARWILGDAEPRRASSCLLTVVRENHGYRGVMCWLPCRKSPKEDGAEDLQRFDEAFGRMVLE